MLYHYVVISNINKDALVAIQNFRSCSQGPAWMVLPYINGHIDLIIINMIINSMDGQYKSVSLAEAS